MRSPARPVSHPTAGDASIGAVSANPLTTRRRELDKKGEPARAVVKAYMDEVRAHVKDVVRHWDRE
jgi:hypothetical protein